MRPFVDPMLCAPIFTLLIQCSAAWMKTSIRDDTTTSTNKPLQGLDTPTGNPQNCTHPSKYFQQPLNHNNTSSTGSDGEPETFLQQYQLISNYFTPGGPIVFYVNDEQPLVCVEDVTPYQYGIHLGALIVEIEHRYFGISMPDNGSYTYNNQDSRPNSFMGSLTFENILLDSVTLVNWIKSTVPGVNESKVIVVGGSYGGFSSYSLRQHYP